ncbi:exodeoxyribonuclease V subunit alpha [Buchnera aphidicola (Diuraphis noxia)]|uniref:RecBCD enzyme subunit RecD n=1 Tax=Buchnera aphidicola subsp. Diuraphis noxia TaxID=118101 RepID=A0A1B2H9E0_BUCDN|nr:exodeoxyribonuclease V subunit alpha [Buchnera aphidicola]ANZ22805.1 exodeoxyribonuclease V subunit alpha [Buchnera aphidicola (Diuraphis noxia)]
MFTLLKQALSKKMIHPIDLYFGNFVAQKSNIFMLIATCVSYENRNGHVFLSIEYFKKNSFSSIFDKKILKKCFNILGKDVNWKKEILKHTAISNGSILTPLVFFKKKIYLYKMWKAESNILKILHKRYNPKINKVKCAIILENLFLNKKDNIQKIAVAISLINKITFIIGGPGTGKTTIILKIIIASIKNSKNPIKIQLSALTGKATTHLNEILKNNIFDLYLSEKEKISLPYEALTIHRLLGIQKTSQKTFFKENNLLNLDILIIDESSMIDLLMMEKIFYAVSKHTKLIFLGDHHQLPPIEPGCIFQNICYYSKDGYSLQHLTRISKLIQYRCLKKQNKKKSNFISDKICVLKKNYRFNKNSGMYILSNAIYSKNIKIIKKLFNNSINNIFFHETNSIIEYHNMIEYISLTYKNFWEKIYNKKEIKEIIKIFQNYQVLCTLNESIFGVQILNQKIEEAMYKNYMIKKFYINEKIWYVGKPIIITHNNTYLNLFNGNIGITNINKKGIFQVSFLKENDRVLNIPINVLRDYDTAWTTTVHKAQGSEFTHTFLVLPNFDSQVLNKDILYTSITRARNTLHIFATRKVFLKTVLKNTDISNSLIDRINDFKS